MGSTVSSKILVFHKIASQFVKCEVNTMFMWTSKKTLVKFDAKILSISRRIAVKRCGEMQLWTGLTCPWPSVAAATNEVIKYTQNERGNISIPSKRAEYVCEAWERRCFLLKCRVGVCLWSSDTADTAQPQSAETYQGLQHDRAAMGHWLPATAPHHHCSWSTHSYQLQQFPLNFL